MSTRSCAAWLAVTVMVSVLPLEAHAHDMRPRLRASNKVEGAAPSGVGGKAGTHGATQSQDAQPAEASALALSPNSRVRGVDPEARRFLELAIAASATVARMVTELEATDLIVWVEANAFLTKTRGEMLVVAASREVRHVRIKVKTPGWLPEMISVLGHELQHALEVAAAPEVRDAAAQRKFYRRVGYKAMDGDYFETEAAVAAERRVLAEAASSR